MHSKQESRKRHKSEIKRMYLLHSRTLFRSEFDAMHEGFSNAYLVKEMLNTTAYRLIFTTATISSPKQFYQVVHYATQNKHLQDRLKIF